MPDIAKQCLARGVGNVWEGSECQVQAEEGDVMSKCESVTKLSKFEFYHIFAGAGFEPATSRL